MFASLTPADILIMLKNIPLAIFTLWTLSTGQIDRWYIFDILMKIGFTPVRQKGSHVILRKETSEGKKTTVVLLHNEIDRGTLLEIIRQSGMTKEEFLNLV